MPKSTSKFYNFRTRVWYRWLHRPIRQKVVFQTKPKQPQLTVVFLHGISATSETWRVTLREFSQNLDLKNVRLIALDLLGFGKSLQANWLKYDYEEYRHSLDNTLRHLHVSGPVVLVGHSMGSLISADYTTNYQPKFDIAGMILVSPPVLLPDELAKFPDRVQTKSYSSLYKLAKEQPAIEVIANFVQRFSSFKSSYLKTPAFDRAMSNIILNKQNYKTFISIKTPTLIVHGHFDPLVVRQNLKQITTKNPKHIRFVSVIGHHDISAGKRSKILIEIKRILRSLNG